MKESVGGENVIVHKIFRIKKSRNLSQIELSEKTGITQSLISRYERGMGNPTMKILRRLAEVLDMNLHIAFIEKSNN